MGRDELIYACYVLRDFDCMECSKQEYLGYLDEMTVDELAVLLTRLTRIAALSFPL